MVPPISKGGGRFLGNEELKKGTRIAGLEFSEGRNVGLGRRRHRRSDASCCLSPELLSPNPTPSSYSSPSPGGERRPTTTELFVQLFFPRFETFQRHFNERTRSILVAAQPSAAHRVTSFPAPVAAVTRPESRPFPLRRQYVRASPTGPPLKRGPRSSHYFNCANGNNSPR